MEGFKRDGMHTSELNMSLIDREAPTPSEKVNQDSVPFMQGSYDFSMILGERIYENREITYTFMIENHRYSSRKAVQTRLENWLMRKGFEPLYDDHAKNYRYIAKCKSVDTKDRTHHLEVTVVFEAYPFKIGELEEGNDIWDTFNFELDISQKVEFEINGSASIMLYNIGSKGVSPTIRASTSMTITKGGITYQVSAGDTKNESFRLEMGENQLSITGNGTIKFIFYKELI